jgi:pimeloyl-ACP methyl ester carboxylesterase
MGGVDDHSPRTQRRAGLAVMAWIGDSRHDSLTTIVGAVLIGWVAVQIAVVHTFSWFHPLALTIGATLVVLGGHIERRGRGALLAVAGVTCVAVGVGLLPHLIDDSVSPSAGFSIVLTGGGLALVVLGASRLLADTRRPIRFTGGIGLTIGLGVAVWLIAPPVAATHVPSSSISSTPADLGLDADSITLATADDVELAGWYVRGSNGAAVVLLHGAGSTRSEVLDQAAVLARNGYGVLMIDARGHGASGGTAMDFGWYGDLDIAAGTEYLRNRDEVGPDRIGVVGMSMGGEEAIGAAASDPNIAAVVAEGATGRNAADKSWLSDEYGWRGAFQEQFEKVQFWVVDYLTESPPPISLRTAVANSGDTSFLLITAGEVPDEGSAAEFIASAAPNRVEVWNVEGSAHTGGLRTEPVEWEQRVVAFLDTRLAGSR